MIWIAYFFLYSFIGWLIDSGYRSWYARRWTMGNAFKPIPIAPIYGFGALIVIGLQPWIGAWPIVLQWIGYGALLALLEGVSGPISTHVFGKPLWKYHASDSFGGYTDLWHAGMWGLLALILVWFLHPFFLRLLL